MFVSCACVSGSIPELVTDASGAEKVYNTCTVYDPEGKMVALHRKVHLFDIDLPTMRFKESETLTGGDSVNSFTARESILSSRGRSGDDC